MSTLLFFLSVNLAAGPKTIPITCATAAAVASVERAQTFLDAARVGEAVEALEASVGSDANCATAQALLAAQAPGPDAAEPHLKIARAHEAVLPAAERVQIDYFAALVAGDIDQARGLAEQLVVLAPDDWRAHNQLGGLAMIGRNFVQAVSECKKAIALNDHAVGAYNNLGYTYVAQEKFDDAVATFRRYAALAPKDPNAHDSLAEALLNGAHFAESENEFQKALGADPRFSGAWTGIAQDRLARGDAPGADAALAKELAVDARPQIKINTEISTAYALLAEGKAAAAWALLDSASAEAKALALPQRFFIDAIEARLQAREGHAEKAEALAAQSYASISGADLPKNVKQGILGGVLIEVVRAAALSGKAQEAGAALAEMETAVKAGPSLPGIESQLADARGVARLAAGDARGAINAFRECLPADFQCQYDLAEAEKKIGDKRAAAALKAFAQTPRRSVEYVYLAKKLASLR